MLNHVARDLGATNRTWSARGHLISINNKYPAAQAFSYRTDRLIPIEAIGAEVRIAEGAWRNMNGWIARSARVLGPKVETGGLVFGEFDEAVNVLWVNEVVGPPPDSSASETQFECGTEGTLKANAEAKHRSRGAIAYLGIWHTHPISAPLPSATDYMGMAQILLEQGLQVSRQLLLIIGHTTTQAEVGAHLFRAQSLRFGPNFDVAAIACQSGFQRMVALFPSMMQIGLALSGGGSRAIAFHLGCLRALNDLGLLAEVKVMSAVSGGSVITAMYAYSDEEFESFDRRIVELLRRGLAKSMVRQLFLSTITPKILVTNLVAGMSAAVYAVIRYVISFLALLLRARRLRRPDWIDRLRAPFRRWFSRTSALEQVLLKVIGGKRLASTTRNTMDVVFNACEMRTGTAFRFSNNGSHSWRFGWVIDRDVSVAHAVAASAAYPAILPAFDDFYQFKSDTGENLGTSRTVITDGGVYDNLGITPLEPGRDPKYQVSKVKPNVIVCCDAGVGQFGDEIIPYSWASRMTRAFEATFRKVQDGAKQRLHRYAETGDLRAFVYAYLGQLDQALPCAPADLVSRESVSSYPTDFSAMPEDSISLLTNRGEVLTRYLVARYFPDDYCLVEQ
jgi:NTE family protein